MVYATRSTRNRGGWGKIIRVTPLDRTLLAAKLAAALGCGLMAGTFFAFSAFVMPALKRLAPPQSIAAMQSINIAVINPLFMGVFLGTALLSFVLTSTAFFGGKQPGAAWLFAGCSLYLVGTFGVTVIGNVPLNDALATLKPDALNAATAWASFYAAWMGWNHVRALASLGACAAFVMSLVSRVAP